ncbi:whey acidic protein-like [Xenopus laevis]|nr:whey acidic protein-like [Xenopus laevis]
MGPTAALLLLGLCSLGTLAQRPAITVSGRLTKDPGHGIIGRPKPGKCPAPVNLEACDKSVKSQCDNDQQCSGSRKCCSNGCRNICLLPLEDKKDSCPFFDAQICALMFPLEDECKTDDQCQGKQRCCCSNCRLECTPTVIVKPGQCPVPSRWCPAGPPKHKCDTDSNCTGKEKCCEDCGRKCKSPQTEHIGFCPETIETLSCISAPDTPLCHTDSNCPRGWKCCLSGERMQCVAALAEKSGQCPTPEKICFAPSSKPACTNDADCVGNKKCCTLACEPKCTDPVYPILM